MLRRIIDYFKNEERAKDAVSWRAVSSHYPRTEREAEQLSAVFACVDVISSAIASLPVAVKNRENEIVDHEINELIDSGKINPWQTWSDLMQFYLGQVLILGNALVDVRYKRGRLVGLWPIPWGNVSVYQLASGRLRYDFPIYPYGNVYPQSMEGNKGYGVLKRKDDQVLHLRDRSDDGITGMSRLARSGVVIDHGHDLQSVSALFWRNGVFPSGALSVPGRIGKDTRALLKQDIASEFSGTQNIAKVLVLDQGASWTQTSIDPDKAEILDSRRFTVEEICRLYNVPPPLIQEYSHNTFTNSEAAGRWFAQFTLASWIRKIEHVLNRGLLFSSELHFDFDMSSFLRGDHKTRWEAHKISIETGVYSPEEVKAMES